MKLVTRELKLAKGTHSIELLLAGCLHVGHIGCDEGSIKAMADYVASHENAYLVLLGDATDAISPADGRFNPREVAEWVTSFDMADLCAEQNRRAFQLLRNVPRERFLGACEGNHPRKVRTVSYFDVHRALCDSLGIDNLGEAAFLSLQCKAPGQQRALPLTIYVEHGAGGAGTPEAVLTQLKRRAVRHPNADAYVGSHHHKAAFAPLTTAGIDHKRRALDHREIPVVTAGCHLSYYRETGETYGEFYHMPVPSIGPAKLVIYPWGSPQFAQKNRDRATRICYRWPWWS